MSGDESLQSIQGEDDVPAHRSLGNIQFFGNFPIAFSFQAAHVENQFLLLRQCFHPFKDQLIDLIVFEKPVGNLYLFYEIGQVSSAEQDCLFPQGVHQLIAGKDKQIIFKTADGPELFPIIPNL